VRYRSRSIATAALLIAYGAFTSFLGARQLAELPGRARPEPDPLATALGFLGFALSLVAYAWLGRAVLRAGGPAAEAARAGALAGALAGLGGGALQALAVSDYLGGVIARYAVPEAFLPAALGAFVVLSGLAAAVFAAAIAWTGHALTRSRSLERP